MGLSYKRHSGSASVTYYSFAVISRTGNDKKVSVIVFFIKPLCKLKLAPTSTYFESYGDLFQVP